MRRRLHCLVFSDLVLAPTLLSVEVANALWKYVRAGVFDRSDALTRLTTAIDLCDRLIPTDADTTAPILIEALNEACRLDHPIYGLTYLVTARRHGAALVTCDRRLAALAHSQGIPVILG